MGSKISVHTEKQNVDSNNKLRLSGRRRGKRQNERGDDGDGDEYICTTTTLMTSVDLYQSRPNRLQQAHVMQDGQCSSEQVVVVLMMMIMMTTAKEPTSDLHPDVYVGVKQGLRW